MRSIHVGIIGILVLALVFFQIGKRYPGLLSGLPLVGQYL